MNTVNKQSIIVFLVLIMNVFIITPEVSLAVTTQPRVSFTAVFSDGFYWAEGISGSLNSVNPASVAPKLKRAFIVIESTKFINTPKPVGDEPIMFKSATITGYYDERKYKVFVESISIESTILNQNQESTKPLVETTSPYDTSDWKIYTNTQYGFEIKYPSDWIVEDRSDLIILLPEGFQQNKRDMRIEIAPVSVGRESVFNPGARLSCLKDIIFADKRARDCITNLDNGYSRNIKIIELPNTNWTENNEISFFVRTKNNQLIPLYNQILSSFKLIEPVVSSNLIQKTDKNVEKISTRDLLISLASDWLLNIAVIILIIISAIWTHNDLKRLNAAGVKSFLSPVTWSTLTIVLWPVFFPAYLILKFTTYKKTKLNT